MLLHLTTAGLQGQHKESPRPIGAGVLLPTGAVSAMQECAMGCASPVADFLLHIVVVSSSQAPSLPCRGVWMAVLLLHTACCIIFPIIFAEGIRAVFLPFLVRRPKVSNHF